MTEALAPSPAPAREGPTSMFPITIIRRAMVAVTTSSILLCGCYLTRRLGHGADAAPPPSPPIRLSQASPRHCIFSMPPSSTSTIKAPCYLAEFGPDIPLKGFHGLLRPLPHDQYACSPQDTTAPSSTIEQWLWWWWPFQKDYNYVAVVQRGQCPFHVKAYNLQQAGYAAMLVANNEDRVMAMGASDEVDPASLHIPSLMISNTTYKSLSSLTLPTVLIEHDSSIISSLATSTSFMPGFSYRACFTMATTLACLLLPFVPSLRGPNLILLTALSALWCYLRMGTFRLYTFTTTNASPSITAATTVPYLSYEHKETDEEVFYSLVQGLLDNPSTYGLSSSTLRRLHLAPDNYQHTMFHHPPLFALLTAALEKIAQWSFYPHLHYSSSTTSTSSPPVLLLYPAVPLLLQLLTLVASFFIAQELGWDRRRAVWAVIILAWCPLLWFLSQKFWIDNMLVATCTLNILLHLRATGHNAPSSSLNRHMLSALGFALSFHSKITSALLLPCLITISLLRHKPLIWLLPSFALCTPWVLTYHHHTSRWIPSAWPSPTLILFSPFVAQARQRPLYFYPWTLAKLSPIYNLAAWPALTTTTTNQPRAILLLWILGFLGGMTAIGALGAGYQMRFIAPAIPALALLTADAIMSLHDKGLYVMELAAVLLCLGAAHCLYYGVLFTPLYADMTLSVFDLIETILSHPITYPMPEGLASGFHVMQHFGLVTARV